jgi:hypothetical protein
VNPSGRTLCQPWRRNAAAQPEAGVRPRADYGSGVTWEERKAARRLGRQQREAARSETHPVTMFFARQRDDILGQVVAVSVAGPQLIHLQQELNGPWRAYHVVRVRTILRPWYIALWISAIEPVATAKTPKLEKRLLWMYLPGDRGRLDVARTDIRGITEAQISELLGGGGDIFSAALVLVIVLVKLASRIGLVAAAPFAIVRIQRRRRIAARFRDQLGI